MAENLKEMFLSKLGGFATMAIATSSPTGDVDCTSVYFSFDDDGRLYFGTAGDSVKARNLAANKKIAVCMDDAKSVGIQLRGVATRLAGSDEAKAKAMLLERHKAIAKFMEKPGILFFRITPEEAFVSNFAWGTDWRVKVV